MIKEIKTYEYAGNTYTTFELAEQAAQQNKIDNLAAHYIGSKYTPAEVAILKDFLGANFTDMVAEYLIKAPTDKPEYKTAHLFEWTKRLGQMHYANRGDAETLCSRSMLGNNYAKELDEDQKELCSECEKHLERCT